MTRDLLQQEVLNTVAEVAANAGIAAYKEEMKRAEKNRESNRTREVKRLLGAYRRLKAELEDGSNFTEEEKSEYRWEFIKDLMNAKSYISKSERIINDEEKRRQESLYSIYRIENAMKLYKEECDRSASEEEKRRYREIEAMYLADDVKTIPELAEIENISEKTVYRDVGIAYKILAIYLFGI